MVYTRKPTRPGVSRQDRKSEAEAAMAEFMKRGGTVQRAPSVVAIDFACPSCGYRGIVGAVEGKTLRCPRCRDPIKIPSPT